MTQDFNKDKWTCPNDRNLQLRAKLNAGWSYRTEKNTLFSNKSNQLSESEMLTIQKVLERSQMLEKVEQERVGKLVDRLENLKKHAVRAVLNTESTNKCAICGDYFYLLRSSPNSCNICKKLLCSKCCIDTFDYSNESTSKSNLNLFRTNSNTQTQQVIWLCRICSEQRELWKKSGAWFFKKYPSYLINSTSNTSNSTNNYTNNNDQSNKSSILNSQITTSAYNKDHFPHHQVSFSMPTTPSRKESIINQNNPLKLWHKDDSQKSDTISEFYESDSDKNTNNSSIDYGNSEYQKYTSMNSPSSTINHILSNGQILIPNSNSTTPNKGIVAQNSLTKDQNNTSHTSYTSAPNKGIIAQNSLTKEQNNINQASNNNNNSSSNSGPSSPTSKSVNSSPIYSKANTNNNSDIIKPSSLKLRARHSFRKPKILEWCSNQLSNDHATPNSSPNLNEEPKEKKGYKSSFKSFSYKSKPKNGNK